MTGIAHWQLERVITENFATGVDLIGSLVGVADVCTISRNLVGLRTRKLDLATDVFSNAITLRDSRINLNTQFGIDWGDGSQLRGENSQIEANGTTGDLGTGGIILRATLDDEMGYSLVRLSGLHVEGSFGRAIQAEANGGLFLAIRDTIILGSEGGLAIYIDPSIASCILDNVLAPGGGDIATINATYFMQMGGSIATVNGTQTHKLRGGFSNTDSPTGFFRDDVGIGEGKNLVLSAAGGGFAKLRFNASDGIMDVELSGGAAARARILGIIESYGGEFRVTGERVVGARGAALPADATDLATALTLVNAIKARMKATGGHGLVAD